MNGNPVRLATGGPAPSRPCVLPLASSSARHQGRAVRTGQGTGSVQPQPGAKCSSAQTTGSAGFDVSAPVAVNCLAPGWRPPSSRLPAPRSSPQLADDRWLNQGARLPGSIAFVEAQLEKRRQLVAAGQGATFSFSPLITTLENMQRFIRHIRSGQQFDLALNREEDRALAWLEERTALVLQLGAPYRATVKLAIAFVIVYEALTNRRVLAPWERQQPAFFRQHCLRAKDPVRLDLLPDCRWRGDDSDVTRIFTPFWELSARDDCRLGEYLKDRELLLYPSFDLLDPEASCRIAHLPVHRIGMLTSYARGDGGRLLSPLEFARASLRHTFTQAIIGRSSVAGLNSPAGLQLCSPAGRLAWRQLYLDLQADNRLADNPAFASGKRARALLLFQLFRELSPMLAAEHLEEGYGSFLGCLRSLGEARRRRRTEYPADFRQVTDGQAAMAALWSTRLWGHWQASGFQLTSEELHAHVQQFLAAEQPRLQEHLDFIDRHRGTLRAFFAQQRSWHYKEDGQYSIDVLADSVYPEQFLRLFQSYDSDSGLCHLDNTDLAYFAALRHPDLRDGIEKETDARLPADLVFDPPMRPLEAREKKE